MYKSLLIPVSLLLASQVVAQVPNRLGFNVGWNTSFTDRIGGNQIEGDALNHYDESHYQDWMLDPTDPTGSTYTFTAMRFVIQDQIAGSPETYTVVGYDEDPAGANFPDPAGPWFRSQPINLPAPPAGANLAAPIAWGITITIAPPATPKGDKWIGLGLPQSTGGAWPTDGLSVHTVFDVPAGGPPTVPPIPNIDQPGLAIINTTAIVQNFACFVATAAGVPTGPAIYPANTPGDVRQINLDITAAVTGGVAVTQTNQALMPASNPALGNPLIPLGGTTNFLSGLHPDVFDGTGSTPARADDVGFLITDTNFPNALTFVVLAFGPTPTGSLPITTLVPPAANPLTRGNVCVDFTTGALFVGFTDGNGVLQQMLALNPQTRTVIQNASPIDLWWQGFVLNPAAVGLLEVHATGCAIQHL